MKKLITVALSLLFAVGLSGFAVAGSLDSPGAPSAGSGMYTLQNLYDYLTSGTALTVQTSFQEPASGPGSTMKSTRQIGDAIKDKFNLCTATADNVEQGVTFFCTQPGSWGVRTGTLAALPRPTATPTMTATPTVTSTPTPTPILASCKAIKTALPTAVDGTYTIDPDGAGAIVPFTVYCDMTTNGGGWTLISRAKPDYNRGHTSASEYNAPTASYGVNPDGPPGSGTLGHTKINALKALESPADTGIFRIVTCSDRRYQDYQVQGQWASDGNIGSIKCQKHDGTWSAWYTPFSTGAGRDTYHVKGISDNNSSNAWVCNDGNWKVKHWTQKNEVGNEGGLYNKEGGCGDNQGEIMFRE
ncbi:MAG: fibrinogen-like YCDxxxxGGGW domain-containing protein [Candidatus Aureabacteria bacterium]|nr:fibrinogen-like YCDxxxxGGGW domain-containing protein [Candidatus Auribacterota bacterium]